MSDLLQHECGIAMLRLKQPLQYYIDKYGSAFYGLNKMYLLMEKQHNRAKTGRTRQHQAGRPPSKAVHLPDSFRGLSAHPRRLQPDHAPF